MSNGISITVLTELKRFTYETTVQTHCSEKIANNCAEAAFKVITLNFKNRLMYIPSVDLSEITHEYACIQADFNGSNHAKLAVKYRRSLQNIYHVLKSKKTAKTKRTIAIQVIEDYMPVEFIRFGLSQAEAEKLAKGIANHLRQTFPGVSISGLNAEFFKKNSGVKVC